MAFQPIVGQELSIEAVTYRLAEHPAAPGIPYGQEGRAGVVYQLVTPVGDRRALKVFKPRHRLPELVSLAEQIAPHAALPGLEVCRRTVLTPQRHGALLRANPDLIYAVLMPWVEGPTWMEVLLTGGGAGCTEAGDWRWALAPEACLGLARALANLLATLEQRQLAHCDLSGPNLLLPGVPGLGGHEEGSDGERIQALPLTAESLVSLVDVEQMYGPSLMRPEPVLGGSPGYAHRTAPQGLWGDTADRFAGAVLVAEMLGWCDEGVHKAAWGESFFDPDEMQQESERLRIMTSALERWGNPVAQLFQRAWRSDLVSDCPAFGEWLAVLPGEMPVRVSQGAREDRLARSSSLQPAAGKANEGALATDAAVRSLVEVGRRLERQGNLSGALENVRQAEVLAPAGSAFARELARMVRDLAGRVEGSAENGAAAQPVPGELGDLFDQALAAYGRGKLAQARELLAEVVRVGSPGYERQGRQAGALLKEVERRLGLAPKSRRSRLIVAGLLAAALLFGAGLGLGLGLRGCGVPMATPVVYVVTATLPAATDTAVLPTDTPEPPTATSLPPTDTAVPPTPTPGIGSTFVRAQTDGALMVYVPAGEFLMGSTEDDGEIEGNEKPQHSITLDAFWIDKTEVTNMQYRLFAEDSGRGVPTVCASGEPTYDDGTKRDHPVVCVSWEDAEAYCGWAGARLPTEAEWEKAARGTDGRKYPWGSDFDGSRANYCDQNCEFDWKDGRADDGNARTAPVGSYPGGAGPFAALDMAGNVWEWVSDWYSETYYSNSPLQNPTGPGTGTYKVGRGGSWNNPPGHVRSAYRLRNNPTGRDIDLGFRCASAVSP